MSGLCHQPVHTPVCAGMARKKPMESKELVTQLRDALAHLYDPTHLQNHPLADALIDAQSLGQMTRAQQLRRILLDALEQLSPPDHATAAEDNACYQALHYRYLDGLSVEEISNILAMSPRQIYRKLSEGVEALASLLTDHFDATPQHGNTGPRSIASATNGARGPTNSADRRELAQAALQQLGSHAQSEIININEILQTIVRDLHLYCTQIGADIQLTLPTQPVYIYADRTMFRQALLNLLTNGLDQVTGGSVQIDVTVEGHEVRLHFSLHKGKADASSSPAADMPTSHHFTKREGIGLEVAIQLFEMQKLQVNAGTQADLWPVDVWMAQTTPQQILVIDDMPDIPPLFRRFTSACAIDVISAAGGDEALALLQQVTPDLILLDVMLPRRDGWEILQTLKANPTTAAIPVVICSILNEPGLALALGADSYLPKPVSQEALLRVLAQFLQPFPEPAAVQP